MAKRKLEDLLQIKDSAAISIGKQTKKPTERHHAPKPQTSDHQLQDNPSPKRSQGSYQRKGPVDVSKEASSLTYPAPQNKNLLKLPSNTTISKRPINHGPIASRFADSNVQKVVYVSRKTPVISAVKRVKQFLREIEKRALQSAGADDVLSRTATGRNGAGELQVKLREVSTKLERNGEEVLVRASGRAIEQALRVADWFRNREDEMLCKIDVRTGSVSVVDDIVEVEEDDVDCTPGKELEGDGDANMQEDSISLEMGDTTMELLGHLEGQQVEATGKNNEERVDGVEVQGDSEERPQHAKRKRKRNKRREYDQNDVPEARLRWVKTVEVAISLQA